MMLMIISMFSIILFRILSDVLLVVLDNAPIYTVDDGDTAAAAVAVLLMLTIIVIMSNCQYVVHNVANDTVMLLMLR